MAVQMFSQVVRLFDELRYEPTAKRIRVLADGRPVRLDLMEPSPTRTACADKGVASYLARGGEDLAWTYERPLPDARELAGLVCFFDERVDVAVDGEQGPCPVTPWSD